MKKKLRISRIEARYIAYQYAFGWISEAAHSKNADFYQEFMSSSMLDVDKLDEMSPYGNCMMFYPNDVEVDLIMSEIKKLEMLLHREMMRLRYKYQEKTGKDVIGRLLNSPPNPEGSDTTDDHSSNSATN